MRYHRRHTELGDRLNHSAVLLELCFNGGRYQNTLYVPAAEGGSQFTGGYICNELRKNFL